MSILSRIAGVYKSTPPALSSNQEASLRLDASGKLVTTTFPEAFFQTLAVQNTTADASSAQLIFANSGCLSVLVQLTQTSTLTGGAVTFEFSYDGGVNWLACPASDVLDPTSTTYAQISIPYTVQASTNKQFLIVVNGASALRIRTSTTITGTGTVTPNFSLLAYNPATAGTITAKIVGNAGATVDSTVDAGAAPTNQIVVGQIANTAAPTPTNGQAIALQGDKAGNLRVNPTGNVGSFTIQSNSPAAGVQASLTVPAGKKWILKSTGITLVCSSQVASRKTGIKVTDASANEIAHATSAAPLTASQNGRGIFAPSLATDAAMVNGNAATGFPEVRLGPGHLITTSVFALQTGDVISMFCNIEEYSD